VTAEPGLRQRQKQRIQESIQDAATRLFLASGFDAVSVNEIAAAAEVSKRTLFKYFASKEDLVIGAFVDHQDEPARVVRDRPAGQDPLDALHGHFISGLTRRDPVTGLDDHPQTLAFVAMVLSAPALQARLMLYQTRGETALTTALAATTDRPDDGLARLAAYQILAAHRALTDDNRHHLTAGLSADERYPDAVAAADRAFDVLRHGLPDCY
jgi:AcrR family transcriptional regulator